MMIVEVILVLLGVIILIGLWFILKNIVKLVINSVLGLLLLWIVNFFHIFSLIGVSDIQITWFSVLVCAFGGIPGAALLMILHLIGLV